MKYIVDRFEGDMAVCENEKREIINVPAKLLEGFVEGDAFSVCREESGRKEKITKLVDDLFE